MNRDGNSINSNNARTIILLVGFSILLFLSTKVPNPEYFISDPDGGHQLTGAMQILSGEHPFIDFRSSYGPLTFYASAFGQIVSDNRIIGEILLVISGYLAAYLLLFKLFVAVSKKLSISVICLCFALMLMPRFYKYYIALGPVLTLFSAWEYIDYKSIKSMVLMAFAIVITGLYRLDFGVYTALCGFMTILLVNFKHQTIEILKTLSMFLLAIICFASPWLLWALYKGGLGNYIGDTLSGILHQGIGLSIPFPYYQDNQSVTSNNNIIFILFVFYNIIPLVSLTVLVSQKSKLMQSEKFKILVAILLSQFTLVQAMHRSDFGHLLQSIIIDYVLIAWLLSIVITNYSQGTWKAKMGRASCAITFIFVGGLSVLLSKNLDMLPNANIKSVITNLQSLLGNKNEILDIVKANDPANEYLQTIEYIKNNTHKDQYILAIPFFTSFYYFAERKFGGGQMLLAPGYFSSDEDQRVMVSRLIKDNVALVVEEPNASYDGLESRKIVNYANFVNKYIKNNYVEVRKIGKFVIKAHI